MGPVQPCPPCVALAHSWDPGTYSEELLFVFSKHMDHQQEQVIVVYSVRRTSVGRTRGQREQGQGEATQAHGDDVRTQVRRHQRATPLPTTQPKLGLPGAVLSLCGRQTPSVP